MPRPNNVCLYRAVERTTNFQRIANASKADQLSGPTAMRGLYALKKAAAGDAYSQVHAGFRMQHDLGRT